AELGPDHLTASAETFADAGHDVIEVFPSAGRFIAAFTRKVQKLADDGVHIFDITDHARLQSIMLSVNQHFDAEAQARQRRSKIVRNAGEQYRPVSVDTFQIRSHLIEGMRKHADLGGAIFIEWCRRLAGANFASC